MWEKMKSPLNLPLTFAWQIFFFSWLQRGKNVFSEGQFWNMKENSRCSFHFSISYQSSPSPKFIHTKTKRMQRSYFETQLSNGVWHEVYSSYYFLPQLVRDSLTFSWIFLDIKQSRKKPTYSFCFIKFLTLPQVGCRICVIQGIWMSMLNMKIMGWMS